ncbi:hypothetical protein KHC33_02835 [Methanospirillum sp. J.3.6.1-F.2.7.3]|uniref:Uncharacterized protein n=1 Tax=Methanospirillum purgamenti TaxID=2834276 RepID=A0A8E7EHX8_9EURY|nr:MULTISPECIES: hypothetical protein [Methanospirillum]MDX8551401.1 hypothetical protein [Methanospirillum hungatei]QVV89472.1 hypothetical protein KHC33_02835 [Methanospirillum sp. J.3.6.1-F.2.7.3]
MKKKLELKTQSLGSEPDIPDITTLKEFIALYRGYEADLVTFQMLRSYSDQKSADIHTIGVGGGYMRQRMEEGLKWDAEQGPLIHVDDLVYDYSLITSKSGGIWSVHESPSVLSTCPSQDDEDSFAEMYHGFRQILRTLRDNRIFSHIIHLESPTQLELELLSSPRSLYFLRNPTLEILGDLLEHTSDLILPTEKISFLGELIDQFQIRRVMLLDATAPALLSVLEYVDPDHLVVTGYCQGSEEKYWKKVQDSAIISV